MNVLCVLCFPLADTHQECMRHHFDVMHSDFELTGACQYMQLRKDGVY